MRITALCVLPTLGLEPANVKGETLMRVLYVGFFHDGPSCSFGDVADEAEAFTSRAEAARTLSERVNGSGRFDSAYPVCHDGMVATHVREERSEILPASEDAYIDLYRVVLNDRKGWGDVAPEPEWRITVGPRGGMHSEPF